MVPTTPAQSSVERPANPPTAGTTANASSESDVTKKPAKRRKSKRRPSTEKRVALSTATRPPVNTNTVSSISFSCGTSEGRPQLRVGEEERERGAEEREQDHLPPEQADEAVVVHRGRYRQNRLRAMTATRILIVDDHPLTREALAGLLAHNGFDVCGQAASGEEAIRLAAELQPDLALLDLTMPGLDGLHALPRICARQRPRVRWSCSRPPRTRTTCSRRSAPARRATC